MSHEEIRNDLIDYAAKRLGEERRRAVEQHLAGCAECAETVRDLERLAAHLKGAGDGLFDPHPEPAALRRFALGGRSASEPRIGRHLYLCARCGLEVEMWRRWGAAPAASREHPRRTRRLASLALASAAGLVLGVLLTAEFRTTAPSPPPDIGQPVLHVLPEVQRGAEPAHKNWALDPEEPYLSVAVPVPIPTQASDAERYRFELKRVDDGVVWSADLSAARIREHMESADVLHLPAIPTRIIMPGTYEFIVRPAQPADAAPLYRAVVEISYRQSPAATKPPQ